MSLTLRSVSRLQQRAPPVPPLTPAGLIEWLARPRPVRTLLLLMALALALPMLGFSAYQAARSAALQRIQYDSRLVQIAAALASDVDREFERMLTLLDTLAVSQRLAQRDFAGFHAQASAAVSRLGAHIAVTGPSMQQLLNTRVPYGTVLPMLGDPIAGQAAQALQTPFVSNLIVDGAPATREFHVHLPLTIPGLIDHQLVFVVDVAHLLAVMEGQKLQPGWITGISDRQGRILARSTDHEAFIGKMLTSDLQIASENHKTAFSAVSMQGVHTLRAVARSQRSGWLLSANVPMALVDAEINLSHRALIIGGIGLSTLAAGLASLFARLIIGPMQALEASAVTLESEKIPPPLNSIVSEANAVAAALRSASVQLKSRLELHQASERRLNHAQKTARLAYLDFDLVNKTVAFSDTFEDILGFNPPTDNAADATRAFLARVHPDDRDRVNAVRLQALRKPGTYEIDFRLVLPNGETRWIFAHGETIGDARGNPILLLGTNLDITRRKEQEDHIRFLLREVSHRSKNLLAIIQAMATQTAKTSTNYEAFQARFSQRLQGIASSHDLLVNQNWMGVDLGILVRAHLRPFVEDRSGQLEIAGPRFLLKPEAAQSLGLALHELATNATKFGALSATGGKVQIAWAILPDTAGSHFEFYWRENGGPRVSPPERKGFGHVVFERMIAQALKATVDVSYLEDGLVWSLKAPLGSVKVTTGSMDAANSEQAALV